MGAGVALADLDGDGLANDVCNVDPRSDRVTLAPVPGTGERYGLTTLEPVGLPYDTRTMAPMGCKPADMDEDGRVDLLVYYWGRTPVAFLHHVRNHDADGRSGGVDFLRESAKLLRVASGDQRLAAGADDLADDRRPDAAAGARDESSRVREVHAILLDSARGRSAAEDDRSSRRNRLP